MLDLTPATFEEFERETARGNVVPVVRAVLADLQTPVGAFLRIARDAPHAFLLESIEGGERVARYSFLGARPWMIARGRGHQTIVEKNGEREVRDQNAVEFLRDYFREKKLARRQGLAPLAGGAVGYLAYDAACWFEPVLNVDGEARAETNDAVWMFFRTVVAFDRVQQQMEITSVVFTDEARGDRQRLRELFEAAVWETEEVAKQLLEGPNREPHAPSGNPVGSVQFQSNWPRADFEAAVESVKEHIAAGDCYQVVIAQKFTKATRAEPSCAWPRRR